MTAASGNAANAGKNKKRTTRKTRRMSVAGTTRRSNVAKPKSSGATMPRSSGATMNVRLRTNSAGKRKISVRQNGSARISNALSSSDNRTNGVKSRNNAGRATNSDGNSISVGKPRTSNGGKAKSKDGTPSLNDAIANRNRVVRAPSRKGANRKMVADSIKSARPKNSEDAQTRTDSATGNVGAMTIRDEPMSSGGYWNSSAGKLKTSVESTTGKLNSKGGRTMNRVGGGKTSDGRAT